MNALTLIRGSPWFPIDIYSMQVVTWLFVLGWIVYRARTNAQTWAAVAATLILVPIFFGADALRTLIVVGGLLLLQFRPTVTVPRAVATAASTVASASLGIYLTHFGVLPLAGLGVPPVLVVAAGIAVGVVGSRLNGAAVRQVQGRLAGHPDTDPFAGRRQLVPGAARGHRDASLVDQ